MQKGNQWTAAVLAIGSVLLLSACGGSSDTVTHEPATLEQIEGTAVTRITLTPKAAERVGIETIRIRDEVVYRKRIVGGEVVAAPEATATAVGPKSAPSGPRSVWVRVAINPSDLSKIDRRIPVRIFLPRAGEGSVGFTARAVSLPANGRQTNPPDARYFRPDAAGHGLVQGQRVRVELSLTGSGTRRKVVPYSAVFYGVNGETWAYTSPKHLVFVRRPIKVDYVDGDLAILSDGPTLGTRIVTVGVAELFGTEYGIGGH